MDFKSVNKLFEASFRENRDRPAISNYQGATLHYRDLARRIEKLHIMFDEGGLERGDKVALCSRYQANWAVAFIATLTYGCVPVPLMHVFKPANVHHLVNHSESKALFVDDVIWESLSETERPYCSCISILPAGSKGRNGPGGIRQVHRINASGGEQGPS